MPAEASRLAPSRGSHVHFILTTLPLLLVLLYFLFTTWRRPQAPIYNMDYGYTDDQWKTALDETGSLIALSDILTMFLLCHVLWTTFAIYMIVFIPKRRHLIGRYLSEGESCVGDIIYDKNSRNCGGFNDYGFALYAHPTQRKLVRKRVRVYQRFTRERITILRLPDRPLSGQAKVDLEMDLTAARKERNSSNYYISVFSIIWVIFTLIGASYVYYQMTKIVDEDDEKALKWLLTIAGLNVPLSYAANFIRFLVYRNWMINRGAILDDDPNARKIVLCCVRTQSADGSDVIPYSIFNEEDKSYLGSLPTFDDGYSAPPSPSRNTKDGDKSKSARTPPRPNQIVTKTKHPKESMLV